MRCVTGLRPRNRRSTAIRSRSAPMDSLLSVVALGHRVSTRNGTNSGGAYQWGSRAAPRTRQFQPDHVIAAAAERLRSTCVRDTYTFNYPNPPAELVAAFRDYYGP